jgi:hypothetical protein
MVFGASNDNKTEQKEDTPKKKHCAVRCQLLVVITVCYQWTKPAEWVKKAKREYEKETAIVDLRTTSTRPGANQMNLEVKILCQKKTLEISFKVVSNAETRE